MEHDITLLEGAGYEITLNVLTAAFVPATAEEHDVYGALEQCGARTTFSVSPTGEAGQWLVTIPAVNIASAMALPYQLFVRRRATGHEWLVLSGTVRLRHRYASAGDALATPPLHASATLSAETAALTVTELHGVRGERGYSTYDIAVRQGFEGTEAEWLASLKAEYASEAVAAVTPLATAAENAAQTAADAQKSALASADDASSSAMDASQHMADAETAAKTATAAATTANDAAASASSSAELAHEEFTSAAREADAAREAATVALEGKTEAVNAASTATQAAAAAAVSQSAAEAAQAEAEAQATRAEEKADLLGDAALQGQNNTFAAGTTQTFNGNVALNSGIAFPGGNTTAAEMAAGYFYARRYWELSTDIAYLFNSQNIDALPKDEDGLVELRFPKATQGYGAFCRCRCNSGVSISLPAVTSQSKLNEMLNGLHNNSGNITYGYITVKLSLAKMTSISLDYPLRLWAEKIIIDAPSATYFKCDARKYAVYGNLPVCEEIVCDNSHYPGGHKNQYKWFVALPSLKKGGWGKPKVGGDRYKLCADSVFCILGTIPVWTDGGSYTLHLNILPDLKNDAEFQARLMAALGTQNEDGTYQGALVRVYEEGGSSGSDELGAFTDSYVESKGWTITVTYNY